MKTQWRPLSLDTPLASARLAAGLSQGGAAVALGLPNTPGGRNTVSSPELRGTSTLLRLLVERCAAYGLDLRLMVRPRGKGASRRGVLRSKRVRSGVRPRKRT